jgi:predicted nucleotidyltransferase
MMKQKDLFSRRDEILHIADRYGAYNVRIFGSLSRDDAGPDSDADFLVELEPGRTLLDQAGLMLELETLLGCSVDVVVEQGLRPRLRERILAEAMKL